MARRRERIKVVARTGIPRLFIEFIESERAGGFVLLFCTVASIVMSNSGLKASYAGLWQRSPDLSLLGIDLKHSLTGWINDGLMAVFFLLVGLEIKSELYAGELSRLKNALLPVVAALGGMLVPALIHLSLNGRYVTRSGFGIPMATDIAFSLGALSLLGRRVPLSLKVVLTAIAIIDDLGAVLVIAFFYVHGFSSLHFAIAALVFGGLLAFNLLRIDNLFIYASAGIVMWFFMLKSGVHAAIAGVLLAFAIPFHKGEESSPSYRMQHFLDRPVPLLILPLFALANTCIMFSPGWYLDLIDRNTVGIFAGLILGKPLGIIVFSLIAVKMGMCRLPGGLRWPHIAGMGILGGIGFTMSIFITNLAFLDNRLIQNSKIAILSASAAAGVAGCLVLLGMGKPAAPRGLG